jgi:predicted RNA-binding Zn ribbon-like protein
MIEVLLRALILCHIFVNGSTAVILINIVVEVVRDREAEVGSVKRERTFKFKGGVPCLDFVNTLAWRLTVRPVEYLLSYEDLLDWGRQADLLAPDEAEVLFGWAATDPEEARGMLARAVALREAIHRVLAHAIAGEPQDEGDLSKLNRELSGALSRLRVAPAAGGAYVWSWDRRDRDDGDKLPLDRPLWPVARSAAKLLTSPTLDRVKVCEGEGCGWLYLDKSRNASRRWCDSRDCGNRERVRKHLTRKRASKS